VNSIDSIDTGYSTDCAQQLEPPSVCSVENAQQLAPPSINSVRTAQQQAPPSTSKTRTNLVPNVKIQLPSHEVIGFLDSGSTVSAVSRKVADDLRETRLRKPRIMKSASGIFAVESTVHTSFKIGDNKPFNYTFYVMPEISRPVLLGYDFLKEYKISVHPGDDCYEIDGKKFEFIQTEGELNRATSEQVHFMDQLSISWIN